MIYMCSSLHSHRTIRRHTPPRCCWAAVQARAATNTRRDVRRARPAHTRIRIKATRHNQNNTHIHNIHQVNCKLHDCSEPECTIDVFFFFSLLVPNNWTDFLPPPPEHPPPLPANNCNANLCHGPTSPTSIRRAAQRAPSGMSSHQG